MNTRQTFFYKTFQGKLILIKKIALPLCLVAITGFAGCAWKKYKPNLVYKEWTRTMSQEGIFPVFPPREDVQVGDIWLLPMHPLETKTVELVGGLGRTGIWYDNIFHNELKGSDTVHNFYNTRYSFPETKEVLGKSSPKDGNKSESSSANATSKSKDDVAKDAVKTFLSGNSSADLSDLKILEIPSNNGTESVFKGGDVRRLRQVAFPEFAITNITQAGLNALVPIEYFQVAGGFTFNRVDQISLKIPLAESYGIPLKNVYELLSNSNIKFVKENGSNTVKLANTNGTNTATFVNTLILARSQFNEALENISEAPGSWFHKGRIKEELEKSKDYVWVALINEVFYARAIDISVTTTKGAGGGAHVEPISDNMLNALERLDKLKKKKEINTKESTTSTSQSTTTKKNGKQKVKMNKEIAEKKNPQGGDASASATPSAAPPSATLSATPTVATSTAETEASPETSPTDQNPQGSTIVHNIDITQQDDAFSLAQKIRTSEFNTASGQQSKLGGSISVVSVSNTGVGLRRIYDRPIAVGVRGVIMKIKVEDLNRFKKGDDIPIALDIK